MRDTVRFCSDADAMTDWAINNGISIRGHNIFWESPRAQQPWVMSLPTDQLRAAMNTRITQVSYFQKFQREVQ